MALIYKIRAIAQSDSSYVFWTDSEPDVDGSNAPESVVVDSIVVESVGGTASGALINPSRHDLTHSPVGLWQLDGDITDSSGNGYDLSNESGTALFINKFDNFKVFTFNNILHRTIYDAALDIKTAYTIEFLYKAASTETGDLRTIVSFLGDSSSEASSNNFIYTIRLSTSNVLESFCEYNVGSNSFRTSTIAQATLVDRLHHIAITQSPDGTTNRFYVDGQFQEEVDGINAPTGGASGRFAIGGSQDGTAGMGAGFLSSVKVIASQLSDSEIAAEYNRTLGPTYGTI